MAKKIVSNPAAVSKKNLDTHAADNLQGIGIELTGRPGKVGTKLLELKKTANQAERLETGVTIDLPEGGHQSFHISFAPKSHYNRFTRSGKITNWGDSSSDLGQTMLDLARECKKGLLRLDLVVAKGSKCPVKGKELKEMALAAWCEAFAVAMPPREVADRKTGTQDRIRDELLAELRAGKAGIAKWNARTYYDHKRAGGFQQVDLSGAHLEGAVLWQLNFNRGNFDGAVLDKSDLKHSKFQKATFRGTSLREASCYGADFRSAILVNADLQNTELTNTDLCGADLTSSTLDGSELSNAKFDEHTQFPKGFTPPQEMKWAGKGLRPGAPKPRKPTGPIDFDALMDRLKKSVKPAKLEKALKMLKADRFQLFSEVNDDFVVGVVKSQTDKDLVYSCKLAADGNFACCTQNLKMCGGLNRQLCKHLLVLIVGLAKAGLLDPTRADQWAQASRAKKPVLDKDQMSDTFLRYKAAEAGEVDWRPTETIPEDYYAL